MISIAELLIGTVTLSTSIITSDTNFLSAMEKLSSKFPEKYVQILSSQPDSFWFDDNYLKILDNDLFRNEAEAVPSFDDAIAIKSTGVIKTVISGKNKRKFEWF